MRRAFIAFGGSVMGSAGFQLSVALYPNQLQHYAFLVKWVWLVCGLCWLMWLLSHPWMQKHIWACNVSSTAAVPPVAATLKLSSPLHNVQFLGFLKIQIDPDLPELALATLCFENVLIPGESIANFRFARLRVNYSDFSTGEIVATVFPARWHNSPDIPIDILAGEKKCAVIASCIGSKWTTDSLILVPVSPDLEYGFGGSEYRRERVTLPIGRIKIEATLIGERNLSILPVTGVLTLGESGTASFLV